jgi:hypothetical protein
MHPTSQSCTSRRPESAQTLVFAALLIVAVIYSVYAFNLVDYNAPQQPTQSEVYTEALLQALAKGSSTQSTQLAQTYFNNYLQTIQRLNATYVEYVNLAEEPNFSYYNYDTHLVTGESTYAYASFAPFKINLSLTLVGVDTSNQETTYTLRYKYEVNGQPTLLFGPKIETSVYAYYEWVNQTLLITAWSLQQLTLTLNTTWGLSLTCLL